jgi:translation initiation factor IF-2
VSKIRVYDLSKQLGLSNQAVIAMLQKEYGVDVKSHSSTVETDVAEKIMAKHAAASAPAAQPTQKPVDAPAKPPAPVVSVSAPKASPEPASINTPKPAPLPSAGHRDASPQKAAMPSGKPPGSGSSHPVHSTYKPASQPSVASNRPSMPPATATPRVEPAQSVAVLDKQPVKTAETPRVSPPQRPGQTHGRQRGHDQRSDNRAEQGRRNAPAVPDVPQIVDIDEDLTVAELAQKLNSRETEIIKHLFMKGVMVTVNQNLEVGFARTIATEMGFEVTEQKKLKDPRLEQLADVLDKKPKLDANEFKHLKQRAPVVSIMGHVDHGKTSLLDAIREAKRNIVDTEAGGITQRIGAYAVEKDGKRIVFLDTPGHEAFTTMRMRGAKSTDIAILVVAADDGVMPQTIEAINHAKAAEIPIIVAINKIDKEGADPDRVLSGLSDHGLVAEKWGGDTITVEVSALQQLGIDDLLEMILLVTELLDLKADSTVAATGVIIEAKLDKRKGPVATALVQNGLLKIGDNVLMGSVGGRVRALLDDRAERVNQAGPSTPVEILGLSEVPSAGDLFEVFRDDRRFKQELNSRKLADKEARQSVNQARQVGMVARGEDDNGPKFVHLVIKADTQGSLEAVTGSLLQLDQTRVQLKILHAGTGDVSEADISLASASGGQVIAFNVRHEGNAYKLAESLSVEVLPFDVIYHVTETIEKRMKGELAPETREVEVGQIEVRQLFTVGKTSVIAGCMVTKGKAVRNAKAVVTRGKQTLFTGTLDNLKRFKDDAKEVAQGYECGISFDKFNDLAIGDVITVFTEEVINPA